MIELFPAPVLPTIPIFYPSLAVNERFLITKGRPYLYLAEYPFSEIHESYGQI